MCHRVPETFPCPETRIAEKILTKHASLLLPPPNHSVYSQNALGIFAFAMPRRCSCRPISMSSESGPLESISLPKETSCLIRKLAWLLQMRRYTLAVHDDFESSPSHIFHRSPTLYFFSPCRSVSVSPRRFTPYDTTVCPPVRRKVRSHRRIRVSS